MRPLAFEDLSELLPIPEGSLGAELVSRKGCSQTLLSAGRVTETVSEHKGTLVLSSGCLESVVKK